MKHNRITAAALSAALAFAAVGFPAEVNAPVSCSIEAYAEVVASGEYGENLTWELDEEGTLTFSGTGEMRNSSYAELRPWYMSYSDVKKVIIEDGITSIGDWMFRDCICLTDIVIPDSVTKIGARVFDDTPWLRARIEENPLVIVNHILVFGRTCEGAVTIPEGVTDIVESAFYGSDMTEVTLPESLTSIGNHDFEGCEKLKKVNLTDSITSIGQWAFHDCFSLTEIVIPSSVTEIWGSAFYHCGYDEETDTTNFTICGEAGSYAETYANENNIPFVALGDAPKPEITPGDANCDGEVNMADAVLIMQTIGNPDKYQLSEKGEKNADVDDTPGVTNGDALKIQRYKLGIIKSLS